MDGPSCGNSNREPRSAPSSHDDHQVTYDEALHTRTVHTLHTVGKVHIRNYGVNQGTSILPVPSGCYPAGTRRGRGISRFQGGFDFVPPQGSSSAQSNGSHPSSSTVLVHGFGLSSFVFRHFTGISLPTQLHYLPTPPSSDPPQISCSFLSLATHNTSVLSFPFSGPDAQHRQVPRVPSNLWELSVHQLIDTHCPLKQQSIGASVIGDPAKPRRQEGYRF
ncbi:hypothetical protein VTG60DRAFT_6298 [Thermothelomyces hinnuleus]